MKKVQFDRISLETYLFLLKSQKLHHIPDHGRFRVIQGKSLKHMLTLVSCKELAKRLDTEVDHINNLRRRGKGFPFYRVCGSRYVYSEDLVRKWLDKNGGIEKKKPGRKPNAEVQKGRRGDAQAHLEPRSGKQRRKPNPKAVRRLA